MNSNTEFITNNRFSLYKAHVKGYHGYIFILACISYWLALAVRCTHSVNTPDPDFYHLHWYIHCNSQGERAIVRIISQNTHFKNSNPLIYAFTYDFIIYNTITLFLVTYK